MQVVRSAERVHQDVGLQAFLSPLLEESRSNSTSCGNLGAERFSSNSGTEPFSPGPPEPQEVKFFLGLGLHSGRLILVMFLILVLALVLRASSSSSS